MIVVLYLVAAVILGTAAVAMSLRNLIRSALLLVVSWLGIGVFFLWAGAEFLAFAQALVYAGAISMVVLFAVLLTGRRGSERPGLLARGGGAGKAVAAVLCGGAVAGVVAVAILRTPAAAAAASPNADVGALGAELAGPQAAALLAAGALLTAALVGATVVACKGEGGSGS